MSITALSVGPDIGDGVREGRATGSHHTGVGGGCLILEKESSMG